MSHQRRLADGLPDPPYLPVRSGRAVQLEESLGTLTFLPEKFADGHEEWRRSKRLRVRVHQLPHASLMAK